jgi:DnaJ-class molecular chaperone
MIPILATEAFMHVRCGKRLVRASAIEVPGEPECRFSRGEASLPAGVETRRIPLSHRSRVAGKPQQNIAQDIYLRLEEFFRGAALEVRVNDPGNPDGPEVYSLQVPPETAPGTRFRVPRESSAIGGQVLVRIRARPDFRFKIRGSDLRCDLRVNARRAAQGGFESLRGATGNYLRIQIQPGVARGEVIRVAGEGLPKLRGGRGDLLVRVVYTPEVRITRAK